ncbi:MAG: hypothetical protein GY830_05295 [Bacteroidetes bacterium]|nr:hypothetical protein [Bacteroidota bacterium]
MCRLTLQRKELQGEGPTATSDIDIDNMLQPVDKKYTGSGGGGEKVQQPVDHTTELTVKELYYGMMLPVNEKYELLDRNGDTVEPKVIIFREKFESVLSGVKWLVVYTMKVS